MVLLQHFIAQEKKYTKTIVLFEICTYTCLILQCGQRCCMPLLSVLEHHRAAGAYIVTMLIRAIRGRSIALHKVTHSDCS